jgi:hypothetical protein
MFKQVSGGVQGIGEMEFDLGDTLVFRENQAGVVEFAFVPLQNVALEKVAWYEGGEAQMGTLGTLILIFFSPFLVWPVGKFIAKIRKRETAATKGSRRARRLAFLVSGLNLIFSMILLFGFGDPTLGISPIIRAALIIPIVTALLTLLMLWMAIAAWVKGYWSIWGRTYYLVLTMSAVVFILWANYWNLIGWKF